MGEHAPVPWIAEADAAQRDAFARIEDAGLNASAPPQQRWLDGWLLRFNPGKAKRARCVNAVAPGRLPLAQKLDLAAAAYAEAGLPLWVRITPFSQPPALDAELAARGFARIDDTRVMWRREPLRADAVHASSPPPAGLRWLALDAEAYADAVGELRGSPPAQRLAHALRVRHAPVPYRGYALLDAAGRVQACGQFAREGELVGLYDVFTAPAARGQGLAAWLCEHLLSLSALEGARLAYLQVEGDNHAARRIYARLGFADAYAYHYRLAPDATALGAAD